MESPNHNNNNNQVLPDVKVNTEISSTSSFSSQFTDNQFHDDQITTVVRYVQNHEYKCRFCDRKFDKQQAFAGHQNAHKREIAIEDAAHDLSNRFAGYGTARVSSHVGSSSNQPALPNFVDISHDFVDNRSVHAQFPFLNSHRGMDLGHQRLLYGGTYDPQVRGLDNVVVIPRPDLGTNNVAVNPSHVLGFNNAVVSHHNPIPRLINNNLPAELPLFPLSASPLTAEQHAPPSINPNHANEEVDRPGLDLTLRL